MTDPQSNPSAPPPGAYVNMVPPNPNPPQPPQKSPTFKFNVLLKSDIAQGNHSGQQLLVLSASPETALQDIAAHFGDDLANVEGPTASGEPFVLTSSKKGATP